MKSTSNQKKQINWTLQKLKFFCTSKNIIKKVKKQTNGRKYFKIIYLIKGTCIFQRCTDGKQIHERCSISLIILEIKIPMRCLFMYTFVVTQWLSHIRLFCDPMDCSRPGSSVHGIFQARILEWVPFYSRGDLSDAAVKLTSPALAGRFFTTEPPHLPGSSVPGILQARILERVAMSSSGGSS